MFSDESLELNSYIKKIIKTVLCVVLKKNPGCESLFDGLLDIKN